jgi:hypothetical protein
VSQAEASEQAHKFPRMFRARRIVKATRAPRPVARVGENAKIVGVLLNPKNANVELETNDSQTAARALGLELTLLSSCRLAGNSNSLLAWPKRLRAVHKRPFYSLDRLLDRNRLYCEVSNKWSIVREQDEEC